MQQLFKLSEAAITTHGLSHLLYTIDLANEISRLTFKFTNNMISPPKGTYLYEPKQQAKIPPDHEMHISQVVLKTHR